MEGEQRPIGYWLKHLDRLLEAAFDRALATEGVGRRHWQILNIIQARPASRAEIAAALAPFLAGDPSAAERVSRDLVDRGWLRAAGPDRLAMTDAGRQAHARLEQQVATIRQQAFRGISEQEYAALVDTLRRVAVNLEAAAG